jgi:hypothetical protein
MNLTTTLASSIASLITCPLSLRLIPLSATASDALPHRDSLRILDQSLNLLTIPPQGLGVIEYFVHSRPILFPVLFNRTLPVLQSTHIFMEVLADVPDERYVLV